MSWRNICCLVAEGSIFAVFFGERAEEVPDKQTLTLHPHSAGQNHTSSHLLEHTHKPASSPGPEDDVLELLEAEVDQEDSEREALTEKLFGRIKQDFEPWKDGITLEMVERLYCTVSFFYTPGMCAERE